MAILVMLMLDMSKVVLVFRFYRILSVLLKFSPIKNILLKLQLKTALFLFQADVLAAP